MVNSDLRNKMFNFKKDEAGAVTLLVAFLMTILLVFAAFALDLGYSYIYKSQMQTACDAAALAGAKVLPDTCKAREIVKEYIAKNGFDDEKAKVEFLKGNEQIRVTLDDEIMTTFAQVINENSIRLRKTAVAGKKGDAEKKEFKYAVFSGSSDAELTLGGQFNIIGSVHSNGTLYSSPGNGYASGFGSSNGFTDMNYYTTKIGLKDGDGNVIIYDVQYDWSTSPPKIYVITPGGNVDVSKYFKDNEPEEEMPYYLGDNIEKLIYQPGIPRDFDVSVSSPDEMKTYMGTTKSIIMTATGSQWCGYGLNIENNLLLDTSSASGTYKIQTNTESQINGNIFINGNPSVSSTLYFGGNTIINGDIYCDGNLSIGGSPVINGNIYCEGDLKFTGGGTPILNGDFVYANSVTATQALTVQGAIVAENDIHIQGGLVQVKGTNSTMTLYSKNGNIRADQASSEYHGFVFAPNGDIKIVGTVTIYGSIIGNTISGIPAALNVYPLDRKVDYELTDPGGDSDSDGISLLE